MTRNLWFLVPLVAGFELGLLESGTMGGFVCDAVRDTVPETVTVVAVEATTEDVLGLASEMSKLVKVMSGFLLGILVKMLNNKDKNI